MADMTSLKTVPAGSAVTRAYFAVPDLYTIGPEFETWDAAVVHAQQRRAELIAQLTKTAGWGTPDQYADCADRQIRIDLRWFITAPDGGGLDIAVESYTNVAGLARECSA